MKRTEMVKRLQNALPKDIDAELVLSRIEHFEGSDRLTYEELREFEKRLLKGDYE